MNVSLQISFKILIIYCCVSTFMILNNKEALLLADEMKSPSANSYNTQQAQPQNLDEGIFKELPKKKNDVYLDVRDKDDKVVDIFEDKGQLIFDNKNKKYLELKLPKSIKIKDYHFLTTNSQPLPFITKSDNKTTTIRILLKQNIQSLEMRYKVELNDKKDKILFIHLKQRKMDKVDKKEKNPKTVQQNKNDIQQTQYIDKDISKNKNTDSNYTKENKNRPLEHKSMPTTTNIKITKNDSNSNNQASGISNNNNHSLNNNAESKPFNTQNKQVNKKNEKDKTLPSFNRDDDVKKNNSNNKKYVEQPKAKNHKKEYAILGVAIVLAMLLLVVSHLSMRKRGKKD